MASIILNQNTVYPYEGGIAHNQAKFKQMPPGFFECEGFNAEGGLQSPLATTRYFRGPWSQWWPMYVWLKGATARLYQGPVDAAAGIGLIRRTMPAQDPRFPHLYCESVSIKSNDGAWVDDPAIFAYAADGTYATDAGGKKIPLSTQACVNNDQGGGYGTITFPAPPPLGVGPPAPQVVTPPSGKYNDGMVTLRAVYRSRRYQIRPDSTIDANPAGEMMRWVERKYRPSIEAIPLSRLASTTNGQLVFLVNNVASVVVPPTAAPAPLGFFGQIIPEAGVVQVASMQVEWRWHEVPDPNLPAILGLMGKINSTPFDGAGGITGYPSFLAGTLLFQQPDIMEGDYDILGAKLWEITVRGLWRPSGWNSFLAPNGNFYPAAFVDPGYRKTLASSDVLGPVYQAADFYAPVFGPQPTIIWQAT